MEKFHMFDDRIYQMTNGVKAADRIIYTVMLNEQKFYHDKGQYYTPSYAHLGQYAGITRTSVIACMKRLEAHGLIKKTNVASNQCVIKVYSLDEVPEVLTELTAKEARKAKLESKVTQSVKKDDPLSQNSLPTESKFFTQSVKIFDTYNNSNNKKELINNNKEDDFEEESLKKGASLCDSHECDIKEDDFLSLDELNDFLSMNESDLDSEATKETSKTSDLDDLEVSSKKTSKQDKEISDVNIDSDHKNTQCPATDDEMDPFDDYLDEESEREEAIKKAQRKAEIKSRIAMAKQKNKVSDLDDFDDGDDDFTYRPKKKTHTDSKKEKIKPKMYYAGGGIQ
ncbi:helix-turn-helix domain-containing protein [Escherichia coli]|uniref:helix-turn-helix domain-containing protein n=1 Tax=Escherichia coli TaxID=562 RepID=UPI00079FD681|nr:helix-turn-helix domain-containing protein [Escherichia coli]EES2186160.1 helix-turn-helix domain-containing protein [Escherichia coli]EFC7869583.1 helix-turn-helix domain-containing protein [Escherichia coli]EFN5166851.1 helix-turn-helix domain-containing protein [Escherichia coli]EGO9570101.1 helix-turn-helix domain-containing protein [Escherichia coli]EGO9605193.1 helix-turn-helix domain-containing protein [Escherichia coli]